MVELARSEPEPVHDGQHAHEDPAQAGASRANGSAGVASPAAKKRLAGARVDAAEVVKERMLQPAPAAARAAWGRDQASLLAGTLADFDSYAYEHPDWITKLAPTPTRDQLWRLLVHARAQPSIVAGLGEFSVSSVLAVDIASGPLARYAGSVGSESTGAQLSPAKSLEHARTLGAALTKLDTVLSPAVQREILPHNSSHGDLVQLLIDRNLVDAFVEYIRGVRPLLSAKNGAEISSFVAFAAETGGQVTKYVGRLAHVRNHHHFKVALLERLAANELDTSRARPLTLILQSAVDHNGAFHRAGEFEAIVFDGRNLVLLIQGASTLKEAGATVAQVAVKYGQNGKIDQLLLAGHGGSRLIQLAAARGVDDKIRQDSLNLDDNAAASESFLKEVTRFMDRSSAHRRIVLDACLTNSEELRLGPGAKLDAGTAAARATITAALAQRPSLAGYLSKLIGRTSGDVQVIGGNGSLWGGDGISFFDPKTAALTISDERDPAVAADKLRYLREGIEPVGVARALVGLWARSPESAREAIESRLGIGGPGSAPGRRGAIGWWANAVADAICRLALANWGDAAVVTSLPGVAQALGMLSADRAATIDWFEQGVPTRFRPVLFAELSKHADWKLPHVQMTTAQLQVASDPAAGTRLLELMAAKYTAQTAEPYLGRSLSERALGLVGPASAKLMIAAVNLVRDGSPAALAFLRGLRVKGRLPAQLNPDKALGGYTSESSLLAMLDRAQGAQVKSAEPKVTAPEPNVDLDGDGRDDLHVQPMAGNFVSGRRQAAHAEPNETARVVMNLDAGQPIRVIGTVGHWAAIAMPELSRPVYAWAPAARSVASAKAQFAELDRGASAAKRSK